MSPKRRKSRGKQARSNAATAKPGKARRAGLSARNRTAKKKKAKQTSSKRATAGKTPRGRAQPPSAFLRSRRGAASDRQSGDLEGLSRAERADSESVEELVEEGNVFEAGAVAGVEEADSADEREVRTREVPEDDVPEE